MNLDNWNRSVALCVFLAALIVISACAVDPEGSEKIPITTSSDEALQLYLEGRDLSEKLRVTEAQRFFEQAVEKDEDFALAHLALATTAATAKEFFGALDRAVQLADRVTEGERHMILGFDAGVKGDPASQFEHYSRLVEDYPDDERARNLLGGYHFGRQEYRTAIEQYEGSTAINPDFSSPYNQLGYAHRFLDQYDEAETAFKKYIELIPDEPNPYDSYAELLMKTGRHQESIENYEKALSQDPNFVASFIGIGNNHMFMGHPDRARETFGSLGRIARNDGERRQALFWTVAAHLHEGNHDEALEQVRAMYRIAEEDGDLATMSGDLVLMGDILLDRGRPDEALARYVEAVEVIGRANVPEEVQQAARRNHLYNESRVALDRGDSKTARAKAEEYLRQVEPHEIPFEIRQYHELAGRIALKEGDYNTGRAELEQANQQNPEVLFLLARACRQAGDLEKAREHCEKAAHFNALNINYAYVRDEAQRMLAEL